MVLTAKVTSKGQLTVPKAIREQMNVEPGDEILFVQRSDSIQLQRIPQEVSPDDLYGSLSSLLDRPVDLKKSREKIREKLVSKHSPDEEN